MDNKRLSVELHMEGSVLTMPAKLAMGYRNDSLMVHGTICSSEVHLKEIIAQISEAAASKLGTCLEQMTGSLPRELTFHYENEQSVIWSKAEQSCLGLVWKRDMFACLIRIKTDENAEKGTLDYYIFQVAGLFGIEQIYLYGRRGSEVSLPLLTQTILENDEEFRYPAMMKECDVLFYGRFSFDKDAGAVGSFLNTIFGIEQMKLSVFMGKSPLGFVAYAMLPAVSHSIMSAEELYLGVECGTSVAMVLSGTFRFSFLSEALFHVDGKVSQDGFMLEAFAELPKPKVIYKNFKMGDTALAIGVGTGKMSFSMYSNLYLGDIKVFGAIGLSILPAGVDINLLSAAITDITLPKLIKNIFGKGITFADTLDFIALSGLPLAGTGNKTIVLAQHEDVREEKVRNKIAEEFNELVKAPSFAINGESIYVERIQEGTDEESIVLVDKSRMRHYSINSQGRLSLQAQFYYCREDTKLGDYTLQQGIFLCGSITLFQKFTVRALFAMSESEGIIAYAGLDKINLGLLSVEASGSKMKDNPMSYFPKDSLLWLLMDHKPVVSETDQAAVANPSGAVFFLRAGINECSFYIDGKISVFHIFEVTASILYVDKTIKIDTGFNIGSLIHVTFQLEASYADFSNMKFAVRFEIDCTGLEKALQKANQGIEQAITKLKAKMNKAQEQIQQAQRNVDELHSQINTLDSKISACKGDIKKAKWWKRAFVAIAKGVEIAAYEVAKAALYTAIGVATAALKVAQLTVGLAGVVGEGVLRAIQGAISATLNLFFVKYIRLAAAATTDDPNFTAEIEFVALGKTFYLSKEIGAEDFKKNPAGILDDNISGRLKPELDHMEDGSFKSNRRRYKKLQCSMRDYSKMLGQGMEQIRSGTLLIQGMSDIYAEHSGEMLPEYEQYNGAYTRALGEVEAGLDLADNSVNFADMDKAIDLITTAMNDPSTDIKEERRQELEPAIQEYKAAMRLVGKMNEDAEEIRSQKRKMAIHLNQTKQTEIKSLRNKAREATIPSENMEKIINSTEELVYQSFPPTKGRGSYINLGRESRVRDSFEEMRQRMKLSESNDVRKMKNKNIPMKYEQRL